MLRLQKDPRMTQVSSQSSMSKMKTLVVMTNGTSFASNSMTCLTEITVSRHRECPAIQHKGRKNMKIQMTGLTRICWL